MSDQQNNSSSQPPSLSEISHLFLSSVRDVQTGGASRPVRIPPGGAKPPAAEDVAPRGESHPAHSIDLTAEEYAQVLAGGELSGGGREEVRIPPVTAVIAQHLNGRAHERVKDYARHLAANGERVGLIEVDASEVRLMCFDRSIEPNDGDPQAPGVSEHFDARFVSESLDEMSWDLDRWLLVLPNLRSPEARGLLREVDHWTLLSTTDHDGVVSCYRTLKGLANVHAPRMTLALMETASETQAAKVFRKLCSVCIQFLGIELEGEPAVRPTRAVAEHVVAHVRQTRDKAQLAAGAQWLVVANFLAKAKAHAAEKQLRADDAAAAGEDEVEMPEVAQLKVSDEAEGEIVEVETVMPVSPVREESVKMNPEVRHTQNTNVATKADPIDEAISEVIDLPGDAADEGAVLSAILAGAKGEVLECPVRAPMCPEARLAVTRDRGLVLLAVCRRGLRELRSIAQAYRWLVENRALIGMAVPQLSVDGHKHPRLTLLVDHADMTAEVLAPMLESSTVNVRAYRKLRWGGKTGLLLEAA
jgi:hypothetical protein